MLHEEGRSVGSRDPPFSEDRSSMLNQEAHDEGYDVYWDGIDLSDNPYDEEKDADAHLAWEQGWRKAREDDYNESEG